MDAIFKYLDGNVNLIFLILAVVSILISIVLYFKSKKDRKPVYAKKSFTLIRDQTSKVKGLRITHNDQEVKDLTLTKFALWNRGRETINRGDVAPSDQLKLTTSSEHKILQADVSYTKTKANNFSVALTDDRKAVLIDFDYFHTNEGVIIDVYHTGSINEHIQLQGTIKGVAQITAGTENPPLFGRFLDGTIGKVIPRGKNFKSRHLLLFIPFALAAMPILLPLMFIDAGRNFVRKVPRDFTVE